MAELPPIREALERHGLWAKKSFGQHFLLDLNLTRRIARSAGDIAGKPVIEVGPGPGGLTRALLEAGADPLIAIEKDPRFIPLLSELIPYSDNRLKVVEGDALEIDEAALLRSSPARGGGGSTRSGESEGVRPQRQTPPPPAGEVARAQRAPEGVRPSGISSPNRERTSPLSLAPLDSSPASGGAAPGEAAHIVANLPYNVAAPLLVKWLKAGPWRGPMTLMFQKEFADRVAAAPRSPAYGRLSVIAQARCRVHFVFTVPARAFTPPPKVDSAVLHFTNRADAYPHLDALERVTAAAFGQRRKMLRQALRAIAEAHNLSPADLLSRAAIEPTARAEEVPIEGFIALTEALREEAR